MEEKIHLARKLALKSYGDLIFIDSEFSSLDPSAGELLSFAAVTLDGRELYIELEHDGVVSPWVKQHIIPTLNDKKLSKMQAKKQIKMFCRSKNPYAVAFVDNYDNLYSVKLFGEGRLPFRWLTIDFSTVLFSLGIEPAAFMIDQPKSREFFSALGIDGSKYKQHHALDDARLLRDVWKALFIE